MQLKIAICGLGAAARQIHLPACGKLPELEVVGGCDPVTGSDGFPFPVFPSLEQLLDQTRPDIVSIVTPTDTHFELAKKVLRAGCHLVCEKPFMSSVDQAREIVDLAEQCGKSIVVNNQYRFMNIHEAAQNAIGSPDFGDLLFMTAHQTFFVSEETERGWRGDDPQRTCKEFGIHVLDLARFYFAADPVSISARMPKPQGPDDPDLLNLIQLEFPGDRVAHITLDRLSRGPHHYLDIRLDGTRGTVETSIGGKLELRAGIRGGSRKPYLGMDISMGGHASLYQGDQRRKIGSDPLDLFANATCKLLRAFLTSLEAGSVPPCSGADNMRTLALVYAAYRSAELNQPIALKYA
jgi:predicted dehydrogenase